LLSARVRPSLALAQNDLLGKENEMGTFFTDTWEALVSYVPNLLFALGVLIVGWLIALIGAAITRGVLKRTSVDNRLAAWATGSEKGQDAPVEGMAGRAVFWVLMLFALVAFFSVLGWSEVSAPLNALLEEVFAFLPNLLSAAILIAVAWLIATGLRFALTGLLGKTSLDERFASEVSEGETVPSKALGETVYWLVYLLFLPAILDALQLEGLLGPVTVLLNKILAFLPNLFAALLILAVGWFLAKVIRRIVTSLLSASGADSLGQRLGIGRVLGEQQLSILVGLVVYVLVLVPVVIAALDALKLEALTDPASSMLDQILAAVPQIFAAVLILFVAFLIGKLVADLVTRLLASVGFDGFLERIGFRHKASAEERTPSSLVGWLAMIAIMLFATIEALKALRFDALAEIVSQFTLFAGDLLLAVVILAIGLYLAGLAAEAIRSSGTKQASTLATVARAAIIILASAMALRQAGLAEDIINLAFGLTLGAAAVATALAFGLGGRDLAGQQLARWMRKSSGEPNP
jgi:hypothetical protein